MKDTYILHDGIEIRGTYHSYYDVKTEADALAKKGITAYIFAPAFKVTAQVVCNIEPLMHFDNTLTD